MSTHNNDIAALAAASVAGSVSILAGSGKFSFVSSAIGLSLMVIVLVYSWQSVVRREQRLAFSVVFSLLAMVFFAPLVELAVFHSTSTNSFLHSLENFSKHGESNVNGNVLFLCWVLSSIAIFISLSCLNMKSENDSPELIEATDVDTLTVHIPVSRLVSSWSYGLGAGLFVSIMFWLLSH